MLLEYSVRPTLFPGTLRKVSLRGMNDALLTASVSRSLLIQGRIFENLRMRKNGWSSVMLALKRCIAIEDCPQLLGTCPWSLKWTRSLRFHAPCQDKGLLAQNAVIQDIMKVYSSWDISQPYPNHCTYCS